MHMLASLHVPVVSWNGMGLLGFSTRNVGYIFLRTFSLHEAVWLKSSFTDIVYADVIP